MRSAVYHGRRDVRIEEMPDPADPAAGELRLDVGLAAICGTDVNEYLNGPFFTPLGAPHPNSGHVGPMIIGHEFFGRVAAVGSGVGAFSVGDRVVCGAGVSCGACPACLAGKTNVCSHYYTLGLHTHGGLADHVNTPADICVRVPDGCEDLDAVLAQPMAIGVHCTKRAQVGAGDSVVVIGAGGIGSMIVHAAAARGAAEVVAVDIDRVRLALAGKLGATSLLDASSDDVRELAGAWTVIEATGSKSGLETAISIVRPGGRILLVGLQHEPPDIDLATLTISEVELLTSQAHVCSTDLPEAVLLLAARSISEHAVDRVIELEELVPEGIDAMLSHEVHGKVAVRVGSPA
jgi:(R,R)-butanediol dehydrogenase / meso-butanediol dehydrogenase / diacetyl reductase